jgi:hypothetical protein
MKALSISGFAIVAIGVALAPAVSMIYRDAFPVEATHRAALADCARIDPAFNRLIAADRAECYAHSLQMAPQKAPLIPRLREIAASGTPPTL